MRTMKDGLALALAIYLVWGMAGIVLLVVGTIWTFFGSILFGMVMLTLGMLLIGGGYFLIDRAVARQRHRPERRQQL